MYRQSKSKNILYEMCYKVLLIKKQLKWNKKNI